MSIDDKTLEFLSRAERGMNENLLAAASEENPFLRRHAFSASNPDVSTDIKTITSVLAFYTAPIGFTSYIQQIAVANIRASNLIAQFYTRLTNEPMSLKGTIKLVQDTVTLHPGMSKLEPGEDLEVRGSKTSGSSIDLSVYIAVIQVKDIEGHPSVQRV